MAINKMKKIALFIGAALAIPGMASAAGLPSFGQWSVESGTISATWCPSTWTCTTGFTESGFMMRTLNDGTNNYFQTVITDKNAESAGSIGTSFTGHGFFDESFVRAVVGGAGSANNGIMMKSYINDVNSDDDNFLSDVDIKTGWGSSGGTSADVVFNQDITERTAGESFLSNFDFSSTKDSAGNFTDVTIDLGQDIDETPSNVVFNSSFQLNYNNDFNTAGQGESSKVDLVQNIQETPANEATFISDFVLDLTKKTTGETSYIDLDQNIYNDGTNETFTSVFRYDLTTNKDTTGALTNKDYNFDVLQLLDDKTGTNFLKTKFEYGQTGTENGITGQGFDIQQELDLVGTDFSGSSNNTFFMRQREGTYLKTGSTTANQLVPSDGTNTTSLDWTANTDSVSVIWMGQELDQADSGMDITQTFGYAKYRDINADEDAIYQSFSQVGGTSEGVGGTGGSVGGFLGTIAAPFDSDIDTN